MAAAAPPAPNPDEAARLAVARACDALITRQQLFAIFDEKVGAADYARWRKDLIAFVASAGQDFVHLARGQKQFLDTLLIWCALAVTPQANDDYDRFLSMTL